MRYAGKGVHRRGVLRRLAGSVLAWAVVSMLVVAGAPLAEARAYESTDTRHAVRLASPAVVRIIVAASGRVVCGGCGPDGTSVTEPADGSKYSFAFSGSGAFISPDGYIMTADHVVDPDEITLSFVWAAIDDFAQQQGITEDEAFDIFSDAHQRGLLNTSSVRIEEQRVFLSTAYTGQLKAATDMVSFPIERIVAHSPADKQDTAIIKVDAQDMPFLLLAPASEVQVQDTVTAVAYPGDADPTSNNEDNSFELLLTPSKLSVTAMNNLLTPTVETGSIIAQKTVAANTAAYETTGISNHGSSGGAVNTADGKIVGFVDRFSSTESDRVSILVASSVVAKYAAQAGVPAEPTGTFMTQWAKAINEYDTPGPCRYTNAAKDLKQLQEQYPRFGGVKQYADDAQSKATPQDCATAVGTPQQGHQATSSMLVLGLMTGGVLLVVLLVVLVVLLTRRGKKPAVAAPAAGYGMPAGPSMPLGTWQQGQAQGGYAAPSQPLMGYGYPGQPSQALPGYGYAAPPSQSLTGYPAPGQPTGPYPTNPTNPTNPTPLPVGAPMWSGATYGTVTPPEQSTGGQQTYGQPAFGAAPQQTEARQAVTAQEQSTTAGESQNGVQQVYGQAYGQPAWQPYGQAYGQPLPQAPAPMRVCANGHVVPEANSQFCPSCGAPVTPPAQ